MVKNYPKKHEIAVLQVWVLQKFSLPPTMVRDLTQSYIKNNGSKIRLHKTLFKSVKKTQKGVGKLLLIWSLHNFSGALLMSNLRIGM